MPATGANAARDTARHLTRTVAFAPQWRARDPLRRTARGCFAYFALDAGTGIDTGAAFLFATGVNDSPMPGVFDGPNGGPRPEAPPDSVSPPICRSRKFGVRRVSNGTTVAAPDPAQASPGRQLPAEYACGDPMKVR